MSTNHTKKDKVIYIFIGTTAELIKLFPVILEFKKKNVSYKIITSGQNTINFREFNNIFPKEKIYRSIQNKKPQSSMFHFLIWIILCLMRSIKIFFFERFSNGEQRNYVIVHGDTISALIGAISAKIFGFQIVHIESGLRSFKLLQPFPEEITRIIISYLANINFCPNDWAVSNLKYRSSVKVNTYENTLIESLQSALRLKNKSGYENVVRAEKYCVLVLHRQEHMFKKVLMEKMIRIILENLGTDIKCVLVMHHITNGLIKDREINLLLSEYKDSIIKIPRLPYLKFMSLINASQFIITDGGSNQEESYYMGKPCLVIRDVTERIEGLKKNVVLSNYDEKKIKMFLRNYKKYERPRVVFSKRPSEIIANYLLTH